MPPKAVFLDLDATLLDYDDATWLSTIDEVADQLAPGSELAAVYAELCLAHWRAAEGAVVLSPTGSRSGFTIWREHWAAALSVVGLPRDDLADRALKLYTEARRARYRLYDDVPETLAALRALAVPVAVVTNGPDDTQRHKVAVTGLQVDAVVTSGGLGVAKPDPGIFEATARLLGVPAERAWHVGDSLTTDVAGARNAGLAAAIWLNRSGCPRALGPTDNEIGSLSSLIPLLQA